MIVPAEGLPIIQAIAPASTRPTLQRFVLLMGAALLGTGRRTVAKLLRIAAPLADGHVTSYQRVSSSASWSAMRLACGLCRLVVLLLPPDRPILLAGDDTVDGHPGRRVYGKARHRDPVRSRHSYTAWRYGHKWVVLAVLVRFRFATRAWALPVLVGLYRSEEDDRARGRPHRTPAPIMCPLLRVMRLWLPDRRLIFVGDAGDGTHEVARFCHRHRLGLTLVSKLHPEPICSSRRRRTTARDVRGSRGRRCPSPGRPPPGRGGSGGERSPGTAGGPAGWAGSAASGTGTRRAAAWCRSAGCSSATATAPTATSSSSGPTRRSTRC